MPYKDPEKQKAYLHSYQKAYHQKRYARRITEMLDYLGGKCVVCGSKENLEFDHIDRTTKSYAITRKWTRKWDDLKIELDKCQLLCVEHHKEKTKRDAKVQSGSIPD